MNTKIILIAAVFVVLAVGLSGCAKKADDAGTTAPATGGTDVGDVGETPSLDTDVPDITGETLPAEGEIDSTEAYGSEEFEEEVW